MYEKIEHCPICDKGSFHNHVIAKDHLVSQESFAIVSCSNCGFKFTNPRPTKTEISLYYQSDDYISHTNKSNSLTNIAYKIARSFTTKLKVSLVKKYAKSNAVLDFGCGTGYFIHKCAIQGYDCHGLEPDENARKIAERNDNIKIVSELSELPKDIKFSVITLWHVLEHIHDLKGTLIQLRKMLEDKGILIVAVPNSGSWDARHYKENWAGYDVPRHLYHFEMDTMLLLMSNLKFRKIEILPQKLDAFYVSILSEKYSYKNNNYFKAIKNGLKSNNNAKLDHMYSSLIYIFSK